MSFMQDDMSLPYQKVPSEETEAEEGKNRKTTLMEIHKLCGGCRPNSNRVLNLKKSIGNDVFVYF